MAAEGLYPMEIETAEGLHAIHCDRFFIIQPMPVTTARDPQLGAAFAPLPQFRINFTLSCYSTVSNWVLEQDEHLLSSHTLPTAGNDVVLNLPQFLCPPLSREIMKLELWNWPLTDQQREEIIDSALKFARIAVVSMPAKHNVVNLQIRVDDTHTHFFVRSDDLMNRVIGESFDVEAQKVPAANSAVEAVVKKKVRLNPESGIICTICLDECGSGKAVRMPCSHLFHGDCIGKWLRIDHCCPVCRFELPVEENMEDCDEAMKEV